MKTRSNDAILTFTDICLTLKEKTILTNINGKARSGQILAIMGPTGSGKTSLLNILAGNLTLTSGTITLNGNPFTKLQRRKLAYVLQSDIFLSRLTLRETLYFTAMIRLPDSVTKAEKMARIDEIVDALHLRKCLDTVIGDFMHPGLSGGEKKRANIACELLTDPNIMLIDEPTSGLDSSTAHVLMQELWDFAFQYNKTILTTIHQPSSQIFHIFSSLLLLVNGHEAYFGDANKALQYFSGLGLNFPDHYNPSDIILELLTTNTEVVNKILEASEKAKNFRVKVENAELCNSKGSAINDYVTSKIAPSLTDRHITEPASNGHVIPLVYHKTDPTEIVLDVSSLEHVSTSNLERSINRKWAASFWTQFRMLSWRNAKQSRWRIFDECILGQALIVGIIFCVIYYQIPSSNDTLRDRMGAVYFPLVYWGFTMVNDAVTSFVGEREVVKKERRAGAYRLSAYYTAKMVSELPMMIVVPIVQLSAMYWLAGMGGPVQFAIYIGINLLNCFTIQSIAYIIGACVHRLKYSIITANTVMIAFLLLGPKFREPRSFSWRRNFINIVDSVEDYARRWARHEKEDLDTLSEWIKCIRCGFFTTSFPTWFTWAKYTSFLHYPFAAIFTVLFADIEPFRCGNSQTFKKCQNETELITGSDVLHSVGIDLPVYCCVGTMVVLIIVLRILGYYAIKYRL
ncbi:uncharacterized protein LOC133187152 isoform X2 [Saccostrea echinata]|uniref:uncharacterized protein LOC133187152 isoform X2 n=1 Tax=Saccostrea echinata TaxID=191078 RepID=UPI002A811695|nr:uncharacterized protein LOC133187152 isoform X2 [Saccostrea echinata]